MSQLRSDATQASLRDEVIDRMAEALWMSHEEMRIPGVVWIAATAALDAALTYLEIHTEEWSGLAMNSDLPLETSDAELLIAVLRAE